MLLIWIQLYQEKYQHLKITLMQPLKH